MDYLHKVAAICVIPIGQHCPITLSVSDINAGRYHIDPVAIGGKDFMVLSTRDQRGDKNSLAAKFGIHCNGLAYFVLCERTVDGPNPLSPISITPEEFAALVREDLEFTGVADETPKIGGRYFDHNPADIRPEANIETGPISIVLVLITATEDSGVESFQNLSLGPKGYVHHLTANEAGVVLDGDIFNLTNLLPRLMCMRTKTFARVPYTSVHQIAVQTSFYNHTYIVDETPESPGAGILVMNDEMRPITFRNVQDFCDAFISKQEMDPFCYHTPTKLTNPGDASASGSGSGLSTGISPSSASVATYLHKMIAVYHLEPFVSFIIMADTNILRLDLEHPVACAFQEKFPVVGITRRTNNYQRHVWLLVLAKGEIILTAKHLESIGSEMTLQTLTAGNFAYENGDHILPYNKDLVVVHEIPEGVEAEEFRVSNDIHQSSVLGSHWISRNISSEIVTLHIDLHGVDIDLNFISNILTTIIDATPTDADTK